MKNPPDELASRLAGELHTDQLTLSAYSTSACNYEIRPLAVVIPLDTEDILRTVEFALHNSIPIVPRGAGSGLAGQAIGSGIILDLTVNMNRVLALEAQTVQLQPGVVLEVLNDFLRQYGLWFPPDPSSNSYCSIGGMIAKNSCGAHSLKYGSTIDFIEEVILVTGEVVTLNTLSAHHITNRIRELIEANRTLIESSYPRTSKNSCAYRLDALLSEFNPASVIAGYEGTLGVIVEARLRTKPLPPIRTLVVLSFRGLDEAVASLEMILSLQPSTCEFLDPHSLSILRSHRAELNTLIPQGTEAVLHIEFDDEPGMVREKIDSLQHDLTEATLNQPDSPEEHWALRRSILPILYRKPGTRRVTSFIEDVTVPVDRILDS